MRWQNLLTINNKQRILRTLLVLAALNSCWLAFQATFYQSAYNTSDDRRLDAFMEQVHATKLNMQGTKEAEFYSTKMVHFPLNNSTVITNPHFILYVEGKTPWDVTAINGKTYEGFKRIELWDHVKGYQPKGPATPETTIETDRLEIFPAKKYAQTQTPIVAKQPGITIHSIGAQFDLNKKTIKLLSQVRGVYVPTH